MKTLTIGLTGFAGVGKDTVADLLVTHLGFRKMAFAEALRAEIAEAFGLDPIYLSHPSTKNLPTPALAMNRAPVQFLAAVALDIGARWRVNGRLSNEWLGAPRSPRQIMQWWGTEYRRRQSPRYWTSIMAARIVELHELGHTRLVITDVRFENEADIIHAAGGLLWQVTRPEIDGATTLEGSHVSATDGGRFRPAAILANCHDIRHLQQLVLGEFLALESGIAGTKVTVPA